MQDQTLEELLESWKEERISAKEAIDQILRHVQLLLDRVRVLERRASAHPARAEGTAAALLIMASKAAAVVGRRDVGNRSRR